MCLINLNPETKKRVVAWKLFAGGNKPISICYQNYMRGHYRTNTLYEAALEAKTGKGFQAFVQKVDAEHSCKLWKIQTGIELRLKRVMFYDAQKGIIDHMGAEADGKEGWSARAMKILPARKSGKSRN